MRKLRRSVIAGRVVAGVALLGAGVAGGWAAGAASGGATPSSSHSAAAEVTGTASPEFRGQLMSYDSCGSMLDALRARARALVGPYGFAGTGYAPGIRASIPSLGPALGIASTAAGGPSTPDVAEKSAQGSATGGYSVTNTQVAGVDEPDIVKTDGHLMVSLDGQRLHLVDVRSPKLRSTLVLPYPGTELLLAGQTVVVLSGGSADQSGGNGGPVPLIAGSRYLANGSTTTATVVDLSDPDAPRVVRTWTFDAAEVAARVVHGTIRLVLDSPPPTARWATPANGSPAEIARATKLNQAIVDALPLDSWLPHWSDGNGSTKRLTSCTDVAIPRSGGSPGIVTVVSLDPAEPSPGAGTSVFGDAALAYAEGSHLYLADAGTYPRTNPTGFTPDIVAQNPTTQLLEFDLADPGQARFLASGSVKGQLHDSYALSEYQDALRVTTTTTQLTSGSVTGISVLQRQGDKLVQVGQVGGLGAGENVYAVRYIGDRGYVVTFRQIDPLHVVDLSDPAKPVLRGTLELTGFSTLLQPLPDHRLLGIGRAVPNSNCIPEGVGCASAPSDGVQVALFDVSDAAHPRLLNRKVLSGAYAVDPNSPHSLTADPAGGSFVMPSTNGLLGISVTKGTINITTAPFSKPYSVQTGRAIFANDRVFELTDRGVAVRRTGGLQQISWVAF
jgi:uncharacterized secreted protein with C-terminal beta-propeller domain